MKGKDDKLQPYGGSDFAPERTRPDIETVVDDDGRPLGMQVDQSRVVYPRLVLMQTESDLVKNKELARAGEIWASLTRERVWPLEDLHLVEGEVDEAQARAMVGKVGGRVLLPLKFLPIAYYVDRVMFDKTNHLVCRSQRGGLRAAPGFASPATGESDCEGCPLAAWTEKAAKREPPECTEMMNALGIVVGDGGQIAVAGFGKTSRGAGDAMMSQTSILGVNPWQITWGMFTTEESFPAGKAYVFRAKMLGYTPGVVANAVAEQALTLAKVRAEEVDADVAEDAAPWGKQEEEVFGDSDNPDG